MHVMFAHSSVCFSSIPVQSVFAISTSLSCIKIEVPKVIRSNHQNRTQQTKNTVKGFWQTKNLKVVEELSSFPGINQVI